MSAYNTTPVPVGMLTMLRRLKRNGPSESWVGADNVRRFANRRRWTRSYKGETGAWRYELTDLGREVLTLLEREELARMDAHEPA